MPSARFERLLESVLPRSVLAQLLREQCLPLFQAHWVVLDPGCPVTLALAPAPHCQPYQNCLSEICHLWGPGPLSKLPTKNQSVSSSIKRI